MATRQGTWPEEGKGIGEIGSEDGQFVIFERITPTDRQHFGKQRLE